MKALLALALLGIGAFAAPVPKEVKKQSPLEQLQGKWVIVSLDSGSGQQVQTEELGTLKLTITRDEISVLTTTGGLVSKKIATPVFDFSADPMRMDAKDDTPTEAGIFKFEDAQLHWCSAHPGKPAPTEFRGGDGCASYIWKRAEK